ncbi:UdgX family uracil-DNA binding protein [Uliginosibacterium sp. H1]|uniref:UdgX family uracil-DNA binding protein n=1 Tax=Uliginosibacterium sp. H1 TaxID=3114757 RepID=UPI002E1848A6|nr:UdgX family uracil-DNA binding protein [Uliginosibacterium sp. H1]MEC5399095.1 UdgX family uracil-DNA binding protein [Uliginosibacterium sp. H1]
MLSSTTLRHACTPTYFAAWRDAARQFLAASVAPHDIDWLDARDAGQGLFGGSAQTPETLSSPAARAGHMVVSPALLELLRLASCHDAHDRWALLYRVLWRWTHGEREAALAADADGARLHQMVKAVRREIHHLHAYVRFRERGEALDGPRFVAWFEPAHDVLQDAAPHFLHRMGKLSWLIATPRGSVACDGDALHFGPAMPRPADDEDAGEKLWLTYYRNTFNPARVNVEVMRGHMPVRFWKNLPEAPLIPAMSVAAQTGARRAGQSRDVEEKVGSGAGRRVNISAGRAQPVRPDAHLLDACRRCDLWRTATRGVPGTGPDNARILIVGEQPGDQEDLQGQPFVGPAGEVLDHAMQLAGLSREAVFLTNAVKHFKWELRGKRRLHKTPGQREIMACHHWLEQELATHPAKVIVALGATALKAVLQIREVALGEVLGQALEHAGRHVVPTYHPSYVLRLREASEKTAAGERIVAALRLAMELAGPAVAAPVARRERPSS